MKVMRQHISLIGFTIRIIYQINRKLFLIVIILSLIGGVAPIISLLITQDILNSIQSLTLPFNEVLILIIIYCVFSIFIAFLQSINSYFTGQLNNFLTYRMNYLLMEKCGELSLEDFEATETYDKINRLENEISMRPYQSMNALIGMTTTITTLIASFTILFNWHIVLFALFVASSIFSLFFQLKIADKNFQMRFNRSQKDRKAWYYSFLLMRDTAFKEVKVLNLKDCFLDRYWKIIEPFIAEDGRINRMGTMLNFLIQFLQDIITGLVMFIAIREAYLGIILIGTALVYMNVTSMVQNSTSSLSSNLREIYDSNLYMSLLREFLNLEANESSGSTEIDDIGSIKVNHLSYDYPNQKQVLQELNFEIFKGERVAIVGENGSGKSTLLKLLCGLYQPTQGLISINDKDLTEINITSYREKISVLFQDFLKFEGSLLDNIHIGHIEKEMKKEEVKQALEFASVNFLQDEKDYLYDDYLGNWFEGGSQLSGGQWQKIALARAYYKEAAVYFLDEPSSALDVNAELEIFKSFFQKSENKIGIFITHRVKIAKQADKIIVMDKGKVIGVGDHHYLYENCDLYQDLLLKEQELDILQLDQENEN